MKVEQDLDRLSNNFFFIENKTYLTKTHNVLIVGLNEQKVVTFALIQLTNVSLTFKGITQFELEPNLY